MSSGLTMKYFVLNPNKKDPYGKASKKAILKYAEEIKEVNPELAEDLVYWVTKLIQT